MERLVIIGAGGHGRVVADCAEQLKRYDKIVFLDDSYPERTVNHCWDIIGKAASWRDLNIDDDVIVAIGNNAFREGLTNELIKSQFSVATLIHPSAIVSTHAKVGLGTVVFANVVVNCAVTIGNACIINTGATIDHDCKIGDGCHISPGANLAGTVTVGRLSWVGIGSSVVECMQIAENTQIGAGAAITSNTEKNSLYVGIPAKKIKSLE